jgi:hypothetical protein
MSAIPVNLKISKGTDFAEIFAVKDELGRPINLNSYTVSAAYSNNYSSTNKKYFIINVVSPSEGIVELKLTASQTSYMKLLRYVYDVVITSSIETGAIRTRVYEGVIEVSPGITIADPPSSTLRELTDVDTSGVEGNAVLVYDEATQSYKFIPAGQFVDVSDGVEDGSTNYGEY